MTVPVRILAAARSQETLGSISAALADVSGIRLDLRNGALRDLLQDAGLGRRSEMLILDVDLDDEGELSALNRIVERLPAGLPIIATSKAASLERMRLLMRLGLADFLPQPIVPADLVNSIEVAGRQIARDGPLARHGVIVGFARPSGGMGATTLAVQSAFIAAGRLGTDGRVCLVDLNLQSGNVGLYLDIDPEPDITDCLVNPHRIDPTLVHGVTHRHQAGFDVIAAPDRPSRPDDLAAPALEALLDALRQEYGLVIADLPPLWTAWSDRVLSILDAQILVTQATVPGIRQARRHLDALAERGFATLPVLVVVNRYRRKPFARAGRLKEAEQALGRRVDAVIPSDFGTVSEAIDAGIAVTDVKPHSPIAKNLRGLMDHVLRDLDQAAKRRVVATQGNG
jgi:pilus assembly protein CpaE